VLSRGLARGCITLHVAWLHLAKPPETYGLRTRARETRELFVTQARQEIVVSPKGATDLVDLLPELLDDRRGYTCEPGELFVGQS
jgi:hypothetical protein